MTCEADASRSRPVSDDHCPRVGHPKEIAYPIGARRQIDHATVGGCDGINGSLNGVTAIFYTRRICTKVEHGDGFLEAHRRQIFLSGTVACVGEVLKLGDVFSDCNAETGRPIIRKQRTPPSLRHTDPTGVRDRITRVHRHTRVLLSRVLIGYGGREVSSEGRSEGTVSASSLLLVSVPPEHASATTTGIQRT